MFYCTRENGSNESLYTLSLVLGTREAILESATNLWLLVLSILRNKRIEEFFALPNRSPLPLAMAQPRWHERVGGGISLGGREGWGLYKFFPFTVLCLFGRYVTRPIALVMDWPCGRGIPDITWGRFWIGVNKVETHIYAKTLIGVYCWCTRVFRFHIWKPRDW